MDLDQLPRHLMATGVLVWDDRGRLLMVRTVDRAADILPGGLVEEGESPAVAGAREVAEEVGLAVEVGRLLVVEHRAATATRPASVQFVFDSAPVPGSPELVLQASEIRGADWHAPHDAVARHAEAGRARLVAALAARAAGTTAYVEA